VTAWKVGHRVGVWIFGGETEPEVAAVVKRLTVQMPLWTDSQDWLRGSDDCGGHARLPLPDGSSQKMLPSCVCRVTTFNALRNAARAGDHRCHTGVVDLATLGAVRGERWAYVP